MKEFSDDFGIKFIESERKFSYKPLQKNFLEKYTIVIEASDGYLSIKDSFEINVDSISFFLAITYLIQYVSPVIGLFGIWKFRINAYNILKKQNYIYYK